MTLLRGAEGDYAQWSKAHGGAYCAGLLREIGALLSVTKIYGRGILLVRPDQHIAWRGSGCDDLRVANAIVARVLGWQEGTQ